MSSPTLTATTSTALETLLDVATMTARLRALLGSPALILQTATLVDHKPGHRAVVHYRGADSGCSFAAYGKAYPELARAAHVHGLMRRLADETFASAPGLRVPRPLGFDPALALVVYAPVVGMSLDRLAPTSQFAAALGGAARWLATLHRSRVVLDRTLDVAHEAANARTWARLVAAREPNAGAAASRLADALLTTRPPGADTPSPIHKDFHYGHVIVGDGVGVVDFDELRMGDPNFDLGHFAANLDLLSARIGAPPSERDRWLDRFLDAYSGATGWVPNAGFGWFAAYTCVKIAKQVATGRGPQPRPLGDARAAQIDLILRKGLGWLAR